VLIGGAAVTSVFLSLGFHAAPSSDSEASKPALSAGENHTSGHPYLANAAPAQTLRVESFDDELAEFGVVPPPWTQVGMLQSHRHQIERSDISIDGDFKLALQTSADREVRSGFALTLVGAEGFDDLTIYGEKINTWSDNESWQIRTPAGDVLKSLRVGSHTFVLKRQGELVTLTADAVQQPNQSSAVIATFAAGRTRRFQAVRLTTSGPAIKLERLRLHTAAVSN
jgi:hypothetical protein